MGQRWAWAPVGVVLVVGLLLGPTGAAGALVVLAWMRFGEATDVRVVALAGLLFVACGVGWLADGTPSPQEIVSFVNLGGRDWLDALARAGLGMLAMSAVAPTARPNPPTAHARPRLHEVDRLRAIAIVTVVLIHSLPFRPPVTAHLDYWLSDTTRFSVGALVFVSGWLVRPAPTTHIGLPWVRRRLLRLLPAYLVASVVMLTLARLTPAIDARPVVSSLLLGNAVGPYYYVFILVVLTIATPLLVALPRRAQWWVLAAAMLVSLAIELADLSIYAHNHLPLTWLPYYLAGIIARPSRDRLLLIARRLEPWSALAAVTVIVLIGSLPIETTPRRAATWLGIWVVTGTLLTWCLTLEGRVSGPVRELSARSYTIYLYHPPVVAGIAGAFGSAALTGRPLAAVVVAVCTCLVIAHLGRLVWPAHATRWLGV